VKLWDFAAMPEPINKIRKVSLSPYGLVIKGKFRVGSPIAKDQRIPG
jgi:hypothetical protein